MRIKIISLVVLVFLILAASLSCTKNTTREQSTDTATPTTAAVTTTVKPSSSAITLLYFNAIKEVYSEDSALNDGISIISLDLSGANNLSAEEKDDLRYLVSSEYSFDTYTYTYDELVDQGLIDDKNLYFEKGILFEITDKAIADNSFTFQISKYRSGIGAIFYSDCTAKKTGDTWEYFLGGCAMA